MVAEYHEYVNYSVTLVRETFTNEADNVREAINNVQDYVMKNRSVLSIYDEKNKDRDIVITNIYSEEV
jgi:hypothetical protein